MTELRRSRRAQGFTLVEVMIVMSVIGILATAISIVFITIVRTAPDTEVRADDARSLLGLSTWLPSDVSATPIRTVATRTTNWDDSPTAASGCGGTDPGTNIIRLAWREQTGGIPRTFVASYRLVDGGDSSTLVRVSCRIGTSGSSVNVTAGLPPVGSNPVTLTFKTETDSGVDYVVGLELELRTSDGDILRVDAASRNPDETLSTVPTAVTTTTLVAATTTTTSTTTTTTSTTTTTAPVGPTTTTIAPPNAAPVATSVTFSTRRDQPVQFTLNASDPNGDALTPAITGLPTGWSAAFGGSSGLDVTLTAANPAAGIYPLGYTVTDPSGASATSTIEVTLTPIPCTTSILDVDPNPVANDGNGNAAKPLKVPVEVEITQSGDCGDLTLRWELDPGDTRLKVFAGSNVAFIEAIPGDRYRPGNYVLELVQFEGIVGSEIIHDTEVLVVT